MSSENPNDLEYTYKITVSNVLSTVSVMMLMSLVISVIPLLLNSDHAIFYTSQSLYIAVILLFVAMMYFDWWGLFIGFLTFLICGWVLELPLAILVSNTIANTFQIILLYVFYRVIKGLNLKNKNMYSEGNLYINLYNYSLILIFLFYLVYVCSSSGTRLGVLLVFAILLFLITIAKSMKEKDLRLFLFALLVALLPSLIASTVSYYLGRAFTQPDDIALKYILTWTLSNYILLQTIGYWFYQYFFTRSYDRSDKRKNKPIIISTILYFGAAFVWNVLILLLLKSNVLGVRSYMYFFPWALGNIFLLLNLYFSSTQSLSEENDKFKLFEDRIIVVEKNTSTIVMIIAFLLPLSLEFLKDTPEILKTLFAANIFCTCATVGLIWIPKHNVKFISLLKSLKTICYTYSISLLLLCVVLILSSLD